MSQGMTNTATRDLGADEPDFPQEGEMPEDEAPRKHSEAEKAEEKAERKKKARDEARLDAPTVYEVIARDGIEEMERPLTSLWWSGVAAGFGISLSLYVMAALRVSLGDTAGAGTLEKFGYCFGFAIVILGRLQLFTENTITPVLPVLRNRTAQAFKCVGRLWLVVFLANLVGTFCSAALPIVFPIASDEQMTAILEISKHFADRDVVTIFFTAIPAGFLVASLVWMLPSSKGFELWTIILITFAIAVAETSHVIVGSTELFTVLLAGDLSLPDMVLKLLSAGAGNIVGGTGLFAILAYAQVSEEV